MFDDQAGIGHILQGKGEAGVRSRGQADLMARLGSARPKKRAVIVQEACEQIATLQLRSIQDHSTQRFQYPEDTKGQLTFIAEQFTKDFEVRVDAHSSSPIFIEDRKADAMQLLEAGAIDHETLLEMFDPPNQQILREKLKALEAKRAQEQQAENQSKGAKNGGA
jgi:hypothetical protein